MEDSSFDTFKLNGIYMEITSSCNLRCIHCYNDSGFAQDRISLKRYKELLDELPNNEDTSFTISGGEPLTHPELENFLEELNAKKFGKKLMITNATLITSKVADCLAKNGVGVQVSLNGANPVSHDKICGEGNYQKTWRGLELLLARGLRRNIVIRCVLNQFNKSEIVTMVDQLVNKGIERIEIASLTPLGRSKFNSKDIAIPLKERSEIIEKLRNSLAIQKYIELGIAIEFPGEFTGVCPLLFDENLNGQKIPLNPRIDAKGDVYLCQIFSNEHYSIGNIWDTTLTSMIKSNKLRNMINFLRLSLDYMYECRGCLWKNICGKGCIALSISNSGGVHGTDGACELRKKYFMSCIK